MAKTVTVRIDDDIYCQFVRQTERERRSLGKFIENAVVKYTEQMAFADDEEMREILHDEGLIRRLKQGMCDTRNGRGKNKETSTKL